MNEIQHKYTRKLVCPYCGEIHESGLSARLQGESLIFCGCGKKFRFEIDIEYTSYADCTLNGKEHDWKLERKNAGTYNGEPYDWYRCKNCDQGTTDPTEKKP